MDDERLYIPYGLSIEQEFFPGFGTKEIRQLLVGMVGAAAVGALLLLITGQLLTIIVSLIIGAAGSMMAVRKDPYTRLSVVGQVADMLHFRRSQKQYKYVYTSPWDTN